jgi:hypothetical protein
VIEQFPIEPEELLSEEAHQIEVYYVEPQEWVMHEFEKKGKHTHGKHHGGGAGRANHFGSLEYPREDERTPSQRNYDALRELANGDPDRIADINRSEDFHSSYSSERHYRPYSG